MPFHDHDKYIDTSEFNKLASDVFNVRLAQANLITKTDFDTKLLSHNRKVTQNKSKHLIFQNELNKLITFDSSYWKKLFWRRWYLNLFSISTNEQICKVNSFDYVS